MTKPDEKKDSRGRRLSRPKGFKNKRPTLRKVPLVADEDLLKRTTDPNTGKLRIPLLEAVAENWTLSSRGQLVRVMGELYKVSPATVDRALEKVKDEALATLRESRDTRLSKGMARLQGVYSGARKAGKFQAARAAAMDIHKLSGDLKPDVILIGDLNRPLNEVSSEAERYRAMAEEVLRRKKKAAGGK